MNKYVSVALSITALLIVGALFLGVRQNETEKVIQQDTNTETSNPAVVAKPTDDDVMQGQWRVVTNKSNNVSVEIPKSWTAFDAGEGLGIAAPGEDGMASAGLSIIATTSSLYGATENPDFLDGTDAGFAKTKDMSAGTKFGPYKYWTKVQNTTVNGYPAVLIHSQTPPDAATEPWDADITWVRVADMNWYIRVDFAAAHEAIFDKIFSSIKLIQKPSAPASRSSIKSSAVIFDPKTLRQGDQYGGFTAASASYDPGTDSYPIETYDIEFAGSLKFTGVVQQSDMCGPYVENIATSSAEHLPRDISWKNMTHSMQLSFDGMPAADRPLYSFYDEHAPIRVGDTVEVTIDHYMIVNVPKDCAGDIGFVTSFQKIAH